MSSTPYLGFVPLESEPDVDLSDGNGPTMKMSAAAALQIAASDKESYLVVPDAYDLTQRVLGAVTGQDAVQAREDLCTLASQGRLICRATAIQLACDAGADLADALDGSNPVDLARSGSKMLAFLDGIARSASVPNSILATFGPLGLYSRVRGVVAIGAAGGRGLTIDQRACAGAVEACRNIANSRFENVIYHPEAPLMFKGGRNARPNPKKGFRETRDRPFQTWLGGQLDDVTDALGIPIRPVMVADPKLRNWPVWAFGTEPLIAMADLQAAEHLGYQIERIGDDDGRVRPQYSLYPRLATTGPDLVAYQRFRRSEEIAPIFVPPPDSAWFRVRLSNLPLVALATMLEHGVPSPTDREEQQLEERIRIVLADCGILGLDVDQQSLLVSLIATGASNKTTSLAYWLGRVVVTQEQVRRIVAALNAAWPELQCHLADRTLGQLAVALKIDPEVLDEKIGRPTGGPDVSFFHRYVASGFSERVRVWFGLADKNAIKEMRGGHFGSYKRANVSQLAAALRECRDKLAEQVVTPTGRVFAKLSWTEARSAFLHLAEDSLLDAAFAVIAAGHRVVAITQYELVVEVPNAVEVDDVASISSCIQDAISNVFGGRSVKLDLEQIERW